jgi:hypothetical protein
MNLRAFSAAVVAGTAVLFGWQFVSNALLPWHIAPADTSLAIMSAVDLVAAGALYLFIGFLYDRSAIGIAKAVALAGFAAILIKETATFSTPLQSAVNVVEQTLSLVVAGLVIGLVVRKLDPAAGVSLPEGQGYYRTSGGRKTVAR